MAGFNTRFHDAGFDIPKYLLPWGGHTVVHEILKQLTVDYVFDEIILLANQRDRYFSRELTHTTKDFKAKVHYIGDTLGQAHTADIGASISTAAGPILMHNADTILVGRNIAQISRELRNFDAYIDVFSGANPAYCYVDIVNNFVFDIAEKQKMTPYASSGLYGFKDTKVYNLYYERVKEKHKDGEIFISDVLNVMIDEGCAIAANNLETHHKTIGIGSPQEYSFALSERE